METTDRLTARVIVAERQTDVAKVAEVQAVRVAAERGSRPTVAAEADMVETAIAADETTRSRIPDSLI